MAFFVEHATSQNSVTHQDTEPTSSELIATDTQFFADEDEARHRLQAVRKHRARALAQLRNTVFAIILAVSAPYIWYQAFTILREQSSPTWALFGVNADPLWSISAIIVAVAILFSLQIAWLFWYRRERLKDWEIAIARADAREPETSADGFMQVFRLYARTKRRAIYTIMFGAVGVWWGTFGLYSFAQYPMISTTSTLFVVVAIIQTITASIVLFQGFDISRSFLPGKVLVTKILILSFLATTSQTDYNEARQQSRELQKEMTDKKPWWFYSYRRRPK